MKKTIVLLMIVGALAGCSAKHYGFMSGRLMNRLELGMSKEQVTKILGSHYTISENKIENGVQLITLSYRDRLFSDEFYLFEFEDNILKKWHREIVPKIEVNH